MRAPSSRRFRALSFALLISILSSVVPVSATTPIAVAAAPAAPPRAAPPGESRLAQRSTPPQDFVPLPLGALAPQAAPRSASAQVTPDPDIVPIQGKPATASSAEDGFPATNANDGDPDTIWYSFFAAPHVWQVDLGQSYPMRKLVIQWAMNEIDFMEYQLAVSSDGSTFTDVVTANDDYPTNDDDDMAVTFTATGRYLRLTVVAGSTDSSGTTPFTWVGIRDMQLYKGAALPDDQNNPPEKCACQDSQEQTNHPVNTRTGAFWTDATDLRVSSPGPALTWSRTYNSQNAEMATRLGYGWQHPYNTHLLTPTMPGGEAGRVVIVTPKGNRFRFDDHGDGTFGTLPGIYETLVQGSGVYTETLTDQTQHIFDATTGQLRAIRDPQGRALTLTYDPTDQRLLSIRDAALPQRALTLSYTTDLAHIASVSDGVRQVGYSYNAQSDLITVTNVMGNPTTYQYHDSYGTDHLLSHIIDAWNRTVERMVYERQQGRWRVTYQELLDGREFTFRYGTNETIIETLAPGTMYRVLETKTIVYGPDDTVRAITINGTTVATKDYDAQFAPGAVTDGNGNTTTAQFNDQGQPLQRTDALGNTTATEYDALQRPVVLTDTLGRRTEMAYDSFNNLTRQTTGITGTFLGFTTVYTYDVRYPGKHWLEELQGPDGVRVRSDYDVLGQRVAQVQNYDDGIYSQTVPDADLVTTFGYDTLGRVVTTTVGIGTPWERADVTTYNDDDTECVNTFETVFGSN